MVRRCGETGRTHRFGGDWTTAKLEILGKYLSAYTTVMKDQPFTTGYVDAFAGTGYRTASRSEAGLTLFPSEDDGHHLLDGSARVALKTDPPFDRYLFLEKDAARAADLNSLKAEFPHLAGSISVKGVEANLAIQRLCEKDWSRHRAVLFLDPYGAQVEWATLEAVAGTEAIDLWVLFPLGVAVNRMVTRSGHIPETWKARLDLLLGRGWYDAFYRVERTPSLFGDDVTSLVKVTTDLIGRYFNARLASIFAAVAPEPRVLVNSTNCPLYLLCFAAANPRGAPIAVKIASYLLKAGQ